MTCVKLNKNNAEFQKLDRIIRENVPSGFAIRKELHHMAEEVAEYYTKLANNCLKEQEAKQVNAAWKEHSRIIRGNPVRIYEGERFILCQG